MSNSEFWTMKEIGALFDKTSHAVGRKLKQLGLRTADGKPSREAFEGGLCDQRWTADMQNYCWAWHGEMTVKLLRESGFGKSETKGQNRSTCPPERSEHDELARKG